MMNRFDADLEQLSINLNAVIESIYTIRIFIRRIKPI